MRTLTISSSKIKTYMDCPALYYWRYVAKRPEKSVSIKLNSNGAPAETTAVNPHEARVEQEPSAIFDSGKLVHRVLELAGHKRITNATHDKKVTKKELLSLLESVASEPPSEDWQRPINITPETIESAAKVLALCWKTISFPYTIAVERKFNESIGPVEDDKGNVVIEDAKLNGVIDRIDKLPNGHIKIVDYKSGWSVMSRAEAELDPQINFYLVIGKLLFPKAEIDMELRYLNRGIRLGPIHYTESRKDWLLNAYVKPIIARMATWSKYPETPGTPHCYSCPRRFECVSFASMVKGSLAPVAAADANNMGLNLALYERLGEIESTVGQLKDQIKPFINAAVEKADDGEIFAGSHRARVIFRNMTAYHDLKATALAAAKAIIEAGKDAGKPVELPVAPTDPAELKVAFEKLAAENARLKALAHESAMAFGVASKIGKAQAGLVNDFVDGLPEAVTLQVSQAIETTSTNAGYYSLEVERIALPFYDKNPSQAETALAEAQEAARKNIPVGAQPILDDSHEKIVEAVVIDSPKALAPPEEPTKTAVERPVQTEPKSTSKAVVDKPEEKSAAVAVAPSGAPVVAGETLDLFAAKKPDPGYTVEPEERDEVVEEPKTEVKAEEPKTEVKAEEPKESKAKKPKGPKVAAWAQPDCKACGGTGISSRGSPCGPCVSRSSKIGASA